MEKFFNIANRSFVFLRVYLVFAIIWLIIGYFIRKVQYDIWYWNWISSGWYICWVLAFLIVLRLIRK